MPDNIDQRIQESIKGMTGSAIVTAQGPSHVAGLIECVTDDKNTLPDAARLALALLVDTLRSLEDRIRRLDQEIARRAREDADARRLATIPGVARHRKWASEHCDAYLFSEPAPWSGKPFIVVRQRDRGSGACSSVSHVCLRSSPLPTSWRASFGRCWRKAGSMELQ
ncbi:hypothetical protein BC361_32620 [Ensifer sp. LC54]|nr:hypothetical protein BC361_32620 [Ensifer sp. LC54]OCP17926.1 hypothetical protein BC363_32810 [Ensifer sp. LC384]